MESEAADQIETDPDLSHRQEFKFAADAQDFSICITTYYNDADEVVTGYPDIDEINQGECVPSHLSFTLLTWFIRRQS
jgi:hypothetical protein